MAEGELLLRSYWLGEGQLATRAGLPDGGQHRAPPHRHHYPGRPQKPVAHGHPSPGRGQPTPSDQAGHVRVQDQRLTPGVQGHQAAGLGAQILRVRQQGGQGGPHGLQQQGRHHGDVGQPQRIQLMREGQEPVGMVPGQQPRRLEG